MSGSQQVLDALRKYSVRISPENELFTLASGEKSRYFIDVKKTCLSGMIHGQLAYDLFDVLAHGDFGAIKAVAGVVLGGCHLASITAMYAFHDGRSQLDVVYVRKEAKDHGTKNLVEYSSQMEPGDTVVLLEDVVTTGGSSMKAAQNLRDVGFDVRGVLAVVDRRVKREPTLSDGLPVRSLFTLDDFTDMLSGPIQCQGVPPRVEEAVQRSREKTAEALATGKLCARCGMAPCACSHAGGR